MYHDARFREYKVYHNKLHQGKKLKSMNEIYIYIYRLLQHQPTKLRDVKM